MAKAQKPSELFEPLLTFKEVSAETGLKHAWIKKAIAEYGFPYFKVGGQTRFRISAINKWLDKQAKKRA